MARDINSVDLTCRLGKDPELQHTPSGTSVCKLWVAVQDSKPNGSGGYEDYAHWFNVTLWGKTAEAASQYLSKGSRIGVTGKLTYRQWDAQDGSKRSAVEVNAREFIFLDSKKDGDGGGGGGGSNQRANQTTADFPSSPVEDDIPF